MRSFITRTANRRRMVLLVTLMALVQGLRCGLSTTCTRSDHCDGSRFFNPSDPRGNSWWEAAKVLLERHKQEWPASIANSPALDLHRPLGRDEAAVTFVNHATVLIQTGGLAILTDPVWSERASPVDWAGPQRHRSAGVAFDQLPRIDIVVVSHDHYDHMDLSTLTKLDSTFHPRFYVPLGNKRLLQEHGIANVVELDWWQSDDFDPQVRVSLVPAVHFSGRGLFDKNETLWGSYVLAVDHHTFYFGGDTAYSPHFRDIRSRFGPPELAFLPIGAYEPRWFMKSIHMNPEEAVRAHEDLGARQSVAIHFGTFQLTEEGADRPGKDLEAALETAHVPSADLAMLGEGQTRIYQLEASRSPSVTAPAGATP